jgi:hypothetical protein
VPPARLKVLWSTVDEFIARAARWAAVMEASWNRDTAEDHALPCSITRLIAQRAAQRNPARILREVEKDEAEHAQRG